MRGAVSAWANCAMLYALLHRRGHFHLEADLLLRVARIIFSAAAMGFTIVMLNQYLQPYYGGGIGERVSAIAVLVGLGALVYFGLAWFTGAIDRSKLTLLTRKTSKQDSIQ